MSFQHKALPAPPRLLSLMRKAQCLLDKTQGYHFGVLFCAISSGTVCFINISLTIWGATKFNVSGGLGTIQEGSCAASQSLGMWLHLGINVLSTLLLGASNYTMQCLSSPTRKDIDRAHSKNIWLDIGVPSLRNLKQISRFRVMLWWMLAVTTIPLHLLYNSAVFTTLSAREFVSLIVTQDFFTTDLAAEVARSRPVNHTLTAVGNVPLSDLAFLENLRDEVSSYETLSTFECIKQYGVDYVSKRANLVLVSSNRQSDQSILRVAKVQTPRSELTTTWPYLPYWWICGIDKDNVRPHSQCNLKSVTKKPWEPFGFPVEHCLSQRIEEHCTLQFSIGIMVIVVLCNVTKMIVMSYIAWEKPEAPLVTIGDALASFLDEPDIHTENACLLDDRHLRGAKVWDGQPLPWYRKQYLWFHSASIRRWSCSNML